VRKRAVVKREVMGELDTLAKDEEIAHLSMPESAEQLLF
jgi:hypothetical protein